jgi:hypothetical protein
MILSSEEAEQIISEDHDGWRFIEKNIIEQGRWNTIFEGIYEHKESKKPYAVSWQRGSTEYQDCDPFYGEEVEFTEMELKEVVRTEYVVASPVETKNVTEEK